MRTLPRSSVLATFGLALALSLTPVVARAQFVVYDDFASFLAATTGAGVDTFDDLAAGSTPTGDPLARAAGAFGYSVRVNTTTLFATGTDSDRWLSTNTATDILTFDGFGSSVRGVGGYFFGNDVDGAFRAGTDLIVTATNAAGTTSRTLLNTTLGTFLGFVSTDDIFSLTVEAVQPQADFAWPAVNDFVLAAAPEQNVVPEPREVVLLATGIAGLLVLVVRRRRA